MIEKTENYSWKLNNLAKGCLQCVKGHKLVVFITGVCPKNCFYCPLSEHKKNKDVIFANERPLKDESDTDSLIEEAIVSRSMGASFTGGDPLSRNNRTSRYIKILKNKFGNKFHIHLYTILESLTPDRLQSLQDSGLDELRFHPDLSNGTHWPKVELLYKDNKRRYNFDIGVEIPAVPGYEDQIKKMIDYFLPKVDFFNINELEISDTNYFQLKNKHFNAKNQLSYGIKGSQELALRMLKYANKKFPKSNIHYCTCKLKDKVQLRERLRRRANSIKKEFDIVTDDGTIVRGAVYLKRFFPEFSYIKKLKELDENERMKMLLELGQVRNKMISELSIPKNMIELDELKPRLITNIGIVQELSKYLKSKGLVPAIVEQYPSYDQMEVDLEFI